MMTYSAMPCSMTGEICEVYAPFSSQWTFCAPTLIGEPLSASATPASATNVGQTTISTLLKGASLGLSSFTKSTDSWTVLNIFQFPAMIGVRMDFPSLIELRLITLLRGHAPTAVRRWHRAH